MEDNKLHCLLCKKPLEHTLKDVLESDFRLNCECGFSVFLEDAFLSN